MCRLDILARAPAADGSQAWSSAGPAPPLQLPNCEVINSSLHTLPLNKCPCFCRPHNWLNPGKPKVAVCGLTPTFRHREAQEGQSAIYPLLLPACHHPAEKGPWCGVPTTQKGRPGECRCVQVGTAVTAGAANGQGLYCHPFH